MEGKSDSAPAPIGWLTRRTAKHDPLCDALGPALGLSSSSAGQFDCGGRTAPTVQMQATIDRLLAGIMSAAVAVMVAGTVGYIAH